MGHNSHKQDLGNPGFNIQFESKEDLPINVTFDEPTSKRVILLKYFYLWIFRFCWQSEAWKMQFLAIIEL